MDIMTQGGKIVLVGECALSFEGNNSREVKFATATVAGNDTISIEFTDLLGEPIMYVVTATTSGYNLSDTEKKYIVATCFTGTTGTGSHWGAINRYLNDSWQIRYSTTSNYWNHTYSNGTLTVTSNSASNAGVFFKNQTYKLFYAYYDETNNT